MKLLPSRSIAMQQSDVDAVLRTNFLAFLHKVFQTLNPGKTLSHGWYLEAISHRLSEVDAGLQNRLIITVPPRYLKSIMASVAWVAWKLGRDPSLRFICVSYNNELALKLARDRRLILESDWYRRIFPNAALARSTDAELTTTSGGGSLATSVGGSLTGFGADFIIIDDPLKADDAKSDSARTSVNEWSTSTLFSRLDDKRKGAVILVMQRLHEADLAGLFLSRGGWHHLNLPAIAEGTEAIPLGGGKEHIRQLGEALHPERESLETLAKIRSEAGVYNFSAQYLQAPVPAGGSLIQHAWLRKGKVPDREPGDEIIQSWDTASKGGALNDYTVCITALRRRDTVYVLDVFREQVDFPELLRKVQLLSERFNPDATLIEDAASGQQLSQMIQNGACPAARYPIPCRPELDKETRLSACSPIIESGQLILPHDAPWLTLFEREILAFPHGRYDDQVDALSQLLMWVRQRPRIVAAIPCGPVGPSPWRDDPDEIDIDDDQTGD